MPVTLTQCRETVRVFNNRNFSFNEKSNFNSRINRVVIPHTVLIRKNLSILNNIQLLPILVSAFLSLNYKYCNTAGHFRLHIFVSTCILVVLHIWSYYIFVLSNYYWVVILNWLQDPSFFLGKAFQSTTGIS